MAKNTIEIPYVEPHGKAFRYRRIVPADVRDIIGKKRWTKTFTARQPLAAIERHAKHLAAEHEQLIARARNGEAISSKIIATAEAQAREWLKESAPQKYEVMSYLAVDPTPSDTAFINALENGGQYVPEGATLSATYGRDKQLYGDGRDEKPIAYAVKTFIEFAGDKELTKIARGEVAEFIAKLVARGMAPATIKRRIGALRAIVNRAFLDTNYNGRNPFEKHKIKNGAGGVEDRLPFSKAMLAKIDAYLANSKRLGRETRNLAWMLKGTGAGPGEIGGLTLSDLNLSGDIPFVWIRRNAIRGVKTTVRDRQLPLIGEALEAAQGAYERALVRSKGKNFDDVPLFTGFDMTGRGADLLSAKLNAMIRKAGVPKSSRLTAYSFRHTVKEALRSAGVADHIQRRVLGHAGHGVADRYGSPRARLSETKEAITAALEHLGDVDESIYSAKERMK